MRNCKKVGCKNDATASVGFSYAEREVWVAPLDDEPHPSRYDLCEQHARTIRVPLGWTLRDLREQTGAEIFGRLRRDGGIPTATRPRSVPSPRADAGDDGADTDGAGTSTSVADHGDPGAQDSLLA